MLLEVGMLRTALQDPLQRGAVRQTVNAVVGRIPTKEFAVPCRKRTGVELVLKVSEHHCSSPNPRNPCHDGVRGAF